MESGSRYVARTGEEIYLGLKGKRSPGRRDEIILKGRQTRLLCWYPHLVVVEELEYLSNPESYAVGSLATGRATLGGQVEG